MTHYVAELLATIDTAADEFLDAAPEAAARRPLHGVWSAKEIVGHLIDSASNNHQRFVRARWQDDLLFHAYAPDDWVDVQDYQTAPWDELIVLWREYNRHIARVMAAVPPAVLFREHSRHNLHEIAWRTVPTGATTTLDYFMSDYVGHLQHHVEQIRRLLRNPKGE